MTLDFYPTTGGDIKRGNFPLTHDCILKVEYLDCSPITFQYFTCCSTDSGKIADILSKIFTVTKVHISHVDSLPDLW